jgi:type II secretory pathway pseudopilin PulG
MTARDRTIVLVLGVLAVIGGFWFMAFSPRRAEVRKLDEQVASAQQARDAAVGRVAQAQAAQKTFGSDRAVIARLGKAVPTDDDTASLVYQLESAAGASSVDFHAFQLGGSTGSASNSGAPAPATQSATAELPPGATVGPAGLSKLPFSLTFQGDYFGLEKFLRRMHAFTTVNGEAIRVRGRLMAVDAIALIPGPDGFPQLQANLTASAFLAPPAPSAPTAAAPAGTPQGASAGAPAPTTSAVITGVGR